MVRGTSLEHKGHYYECIGGSRGGTMDWFSRLNTSSGKHGCSGELIRKPVECLPGIERCDRVHAHLKGGGTAPDAVKEIGSPEELSHNAAGAFLQRTDDLRRRKKHHHHHRRKMLNNEHTEEEEEGSVLSAEGVSPDDGSLTAAATGSTQNQSPTTSTGHRSHPLLHVYDISSESLASSSSSGGSGKGS